MQNDKKNNHSVCKLSARCLELPPEQENQHNSKRSSKGIQREKNITRTESKATEGTEKRVTNQDKQIRWRNQRIKRKNKMTIDFTKTCPTCKGPMSKDNEFCSIKCADNEEEEVKWERYTQNQQGRNYWLKLKDK